jgi:DNA-binding transcriptional LysR family regulator
MHGEFFNAILPQLRARRPLKCLPRTSSEQDEQTLKQANDQHPRQRDSPATMPELDLNLIPYLVALEETRNVSRAGDLLGVSQPRVSAALGKLREYFGDPLFVRTSRGMEPTAYALVLIPAARDALARIEHGLVAPRDFDPATSKHTFSIALSDVGEIVFLPRLLQEFARRAPLANLRSVSLPHADVERGLEAGSIDLAVGYFPDLRGTNFFQQRLFTHRFICLMRRDHPLASEHFSLKQFLACGHAVVRAEGRSQEVLEKYLAKRRLVRRAVLETSHFMSLPYILSRTDLIATVPHAIGYAYSTEHASIVLVEPPLPLPRFDLRQHWHRKFHNDARTVWLRTLVAELYNDALDEWPK